MTTSSTPRQPWDDERLTAAFAARASRASAPADLTNATMTALRARPARPPVWRRLLAPAAVFVVVVVGVTSGFAMLLNSDRGATGMFRDGPTPDLKTFDSGEFAFEYPAEWLGYDATITFSGGSSIAVLGTQAVEPRCGDVAHVDINCAYEQPLEPGDIRVFIGTGPFRSGTVLDRPDIDNGTTTRSMVAGMPAILDEYDPQPESFYREDLSLRWWIGRPGLLSNVISIELRARNAAGGEGEVAAQARAALDAVILSFRFDAAALASPVDPWAEKTAVGLPVVSVSDAIAIRDAGVDDREIAVYGWFHPTPMVGCPAPLEVVSPVQPRCPDQFTWLMERMESLATVRADGFTIHQPAGPALNPDLDLVQRTWFPRMPEEGEAIPVEVVFVGHFDDQRSSLCPRVEEDACRDRFVVDRVDWVNGEELPTSVLELVEAPPHATPFDDVRMALDRVTAGAPLLSAVRVDGAIGLRGIEPSLGTGQAGLIDHDVLWVVRVLEGGRSATYVVIDGIDAIYRLDAAGNVTQVGGGWTASSPTPAPTPLPEPAFTFDLESDGAPVVEIRVVDLTDVVKDARSATTAEMQRPGWSGDLDFDDLDPATVLVRWTGSSCDSTLRLTVDVADRGGPSDGLTGTLRLDGDRPPCDAMGIGRGVVLEFIGQAPATGLTHMDARETWFYPDVVAGLDVLDVRQAQSVQARPDDDQGIAVFGWYQPGPVAVCLGFEDVHAPLDPSCRDRELLLSKPDTRPEVPSLQVAIIPANRGWDLPEDRALHRVVFVGHFDDRRVSACAPDRREICADTFVVDAMWTDGEMQPSTWTWTPPSRMPGSDPDASPRQAADRALEYAGPNAQVLGVGLLPAGSLELIEPTIDEPRLMGGIWTWHVTVLEPGAERLRTFVVPDASFGAADDFTVWEIVDGDGVPAHLVEASPQSPDAS